MIPSRPTAPAAGGLSDPPAPILRHAQAHDACALAVLMGQLGYPTADREMASRLHRILPLKDHLVAVAQRCGMVVGVIAASAGFRLELDGRWGRITVLSVAAGERGRGVGALLLAHAEAWLHAQGVSACIVTSSTHRAAAHRFYERQGYRVSGLRFVKELGAAPAARP
ncbi:MAG: GNAT family N-acetyltransferase [Desulfobacterales bacterium]|nr:GNAT family N-acetyltransferase [Desulfobacterales bacterium]